MGSSMGGTRRRSDGTGAEQISRLRLFLNFAIVSASMGASRGWSVVVIVCFRNVAGYNMQ